MLRIVGKRLGLQVMEATKWYATFAFSKIRGIATRKVTGAKQMGAVILTHNGHVSLL
jgi:hypothetical protein